MFADYETNILFSYKSYLHSLLELKLSTTREAASTKALLPIKQDLTKLVCPARATGCGLF